jgi:hypothetical protein
MLRVEDLRAKPFEPLLQLRELRRWMKDCEVADVAVKGGGGEPFHQHDLYLLPGWNAQLRVGSLSCEGLTTQLSAHQTMA